MLSFAAAQIKHLQINSRYGFGYANNFGAIAWNPPRRLTHILIQQPIVNLVAYSAQIGVSPDRYWPGKPV